MTFILFMFNYDKTGDHMKKIIPYLLSLLLGCTFGLLLLNKADLNLNELFNTKKNSIGFQIGVFTDIDSAKKQMMKYPPSIIIKNDDVYRVYYSVLSNPKTINKMENYLNNQKISFYKKELSITDKGLVKALSNYENTILEGNEDVLLNINKLIMNSYGGKI